MRERDREWTKRNQTGGDEADAGPLAAASQSLTARAAPVAALRVCLSALLHSNTSTFRNRYLNEGYRQ